ncbi:MAG: MBL fold metallo-hydrolase, partial [bacterium]
MEIVLLGTGAAVPTLSRQLSSTALLRDRELLLFDCGEGTQIQLQRAQLKPGKLTRIFISHFHGDHFYGLIGLLTSLQSTGRQVPLDVYGPQGLSEYLSFMQQLSNFTLGYFVQVHEVDRDESGEWDMGEYVVTAEELDHRIFVLGFRLEEKPRPGKFDTGKAEKLGIPEGPARARLQNGESITLTNGQQVKPAQVLGPERPGKTVTICLDTKPCQTS